MSLIIEASLLPSAASWWSPGSQLSPSSWARWKGPLADRQEHRKSGSRWCVFFSISLTGKHQQPDEQSGLAGISFSIWQARLITTLLYNMMHMATHRCWLSLFLSGRRGESAGMPWKHHCICWTDGCRERRGQPFREWAGLSWSSYACEEKRDRPPTESPPGFIWISICLTLYCVNTQTALCGADFRVKHLEPLWLRVWIRCMKDALLLQITAFLCAVTVVLSEGLNSLSFAWNATVSSLDVQHMARSGSAADLPELIIYLLLLFIAHNFHSACDLW